ncbi:MAG: bifunctional riboflavin kinase/FAD synthetase [Actinomycetota bacterium]|nr:bifunctional riboflavin kinase/FAD synthetase [Actinomycetota bacterium]
MNMPAITWTHGMPCLGPAVTSLGVFDGVHLGHQTLLHDAIKAARGSGVASAIVTFDRDPDQVVTPEAAAPQLLTLSEKLAVLASLGPDLVLVVPFDDELAALSPEAFVDEVLVPALDPVAVHVGYDFRFGHKASGDVATLQQLGDTHGFEVVPHELVLAEDEPVTSSRIRRTVAAGDVAAAARLLGRLHRIGGRVVAGRGAGAALGVPTANIEPAAFTAVPGDGVYAGFAATASGIWPAAISVGVAPTFADAHDLVEAHLIGFQGDLYGAEMSIEFLARLREQRVFDSEEALAAQMRADVAQVAEITGVTP